MLTLLSILKFPFQYPKTFLFTFLLLIILCLLLFIRIAPRLHRNGPTIDSPPQTIQSIINHDEQQINHVHSQVQSDMASIHALKPLESIVTVHTYITPDTISQLKIREHTYLKTISDLKVEVQAQAILIKHQNKYIIQLKHTIIKWKIISATLLAIIIKYIIL